MARKLRIALRAASSGCLGPRRAVAGQQQATTPLLCPVEQIEQGQFPVIIPKYGLDVIQADQVQSFDPAQHVHRGIVCQFPQRQVERRFARQVTGGLKQVGLAAAIGAADIDYRLTLWRQLTLQCLQQRLYLRRREVILESRIVPELNFKRQLTLAGA